MFLQSLLQVTSKHKFICISILSILSAISFNIAVSMRESVILSIAHGASFIPFVKTYITLPCTFLVGTCYLLIQRRLGTVLTYTTINCVFLAYFVIFSLVIIPNYDLLTPSTDTIHQYQSMYPNFRYFLSLIEHWPSAIFHVCAEIWSIYVFIILFWQVANEVLEPGESSEFFPLVTFLISFGTTLSAYPIQQLSKSSAPSFTLLLIILPLGALMNLMVVYMHHQWGLETQSTDSSKSTKDSLTLMQKISKLFDRSLSKKVLSLSMCIFSFNFIVSLFESCFWTRISQYYTTQQDILDFYSTYTFLKGSISMLAGLLNIYLLRRMGWYFVLNITPFVCVFAINLFLLHYFPQNIVILPETVPWFSFTVVQTSVVLTWFFAVCLVLSYASKFSFFDPAKEILISTLPSEERRFSKVFADGLSGRTGKISGGIVQSVLLSITAADSILEISPVVLLLACASSIVFANAIQGLKSVEHDLKNNSPMSSAAS